MPVSAKSAAEYREEARRLRALIELITTPALRQILLDAAATYDNLANRQRLAALPPPEPIRCGEKDVVVRSYRYYYLDSTDRVASTGLIDCDSDEEAQARAERLLAGADDAAIEVWDGSRKVHYAKRMQPRNSGDPAASTRG
ncbi:MAG TPA: hypothetical protein VLV76_29515 [Candidatus Acidoferrum sp.]|nr:hypothetical protein [Candidatus Acidoferrum sp.]